MNKFIVITTIHMPTKAIKLFMQKEEWQLIVVGDLKTPHEAYQQLEARGDLLYLHPDYQQKAYPALSDAIGWNTSPRRNIGFVEAYRRGADVLALTDDDNVPYDDWGTNLLLNQRQKCVQYTPIECNVFDPLSVTNHPELWHRGFPLNQVAHRRCTKTQVEITPQIQVDLWDGDPDVDATCRMIYQPDLRLTIESPFCSSCISPFDSQNTFLSREMIPHFMLIPHTGRVDDIWGAYLLQRTIKSSEPYIIYNKPSVFQERNEHNLLNDFQAEVFGTMHVEQFLAGEDVLSDNSKQAINAYYEAYKD